MVHYSSTPSHVRQKACLTLLRLFRRLPDALLIEDWAPRIVQLLQHEHMVCIRLVVDAIIISMQETKGRRVVERKSHS